MARLARILSIALITAAIVALLDVGMTLAYREPVSSIYGSIKQSAAADELKQVNADFLTPEVVAKAESEANAATKANGMKSAAEAASLARQFAGQVITGQPIGRILAPSMGDLSAVVVEGTDSSSLQKGPGHYPGTSFPGQKGTIGIAGHRSTYLAPFRDIADVKRGDEITLEMPYGKFVYRVTKTEIVTPDRVDVVDDVGYPQLVLSACHPMYSAAERYIIFARQARFTLKG